MNKILIDELKRICSIIYNAAGQDPDDEESLNEAYKSINRLIEQLSPAPSQEPDPDELTIAYMSGVHEGKKRKPWVGLTEQEALDCFSPNPVIHSKNVEAKLKEKNT
jgi:hypothetical protein